MLGHFFEVSVATTALADSFEFYGALGFRSIPTGDAPRAPAAAFYDGAVTVGLYDAEPAEPALTFVRPQLKDYVRGLRHVGVALEHAQLADDGFHEVRFTDPDGQAVRLIEARTHSPGAWDERNVTACGTFLEYSIPVESIERARAFWTELGLATVAEGAEPHPWARLTGRGLTLGLHAARVRPGLRFAAANVAARIEYLKAKGFGVRSGCPFATAAAATVVAPEGTPLYLHEP